MRKIQMNEQIKLLAEQAGSTHKQNLGVYQFFTDELKKFAELIVRECAMIADMYADELLSTNPSEHIKRHFGVEE
jgi:hypothetical protein